MDYGTGEFHFVIKVQDYSVTIGRRMLLQDISLSISKGEIFGIVGPSGSGKTTLLRSIAGTGLAGKGTIEVLGHRVPKSRVLGRLGYMAQADALYEDLTGKENLTFFAGLYGLRGKVFKSRFHTVVRLVELDRDITQLVRNYSGGMKRRLSLAIALIHNPKVLLLDEPTVGVDPVLRQAFWQEFSKRKTDGTTLVITTHVMDEAKRCDRLAFIRDGRVLALGTPDELLLNSGADDLEGAFVHYAQSVAEQKPLGGGRRRRSRSHEEPPKDSCGESERSRRNKQTRKGRDH